VLPILGDLLAGSFSVVLLGVGGSTSTFVRGNSFRGRCGRNGTFVVMLAASWLAHPSDLLDPLPVISDLGRILPKKVNLGITGETTFEANPLGCWLSRKIVYLSL
jgi:hypothetical protein